MVMRGLVRRVKARPGKVARRQECPPYGDVDDVIVEA